MSDCLGSSSSLCFFLVHIFAILHKAPFFRSNDCTGLYCIHAVKHSANVCQRAPTYREPQLIAEICCRSSFYIFMNMLTIEHTIVINIDSFPNLHHSLWSSVVNALYYIVSVSWYVAKVKMEIYDFNRLIDVTTKFYTLCRMHKMKVHTHFKFSIVKHPLYKMIEEHTQ